MSSKVETSDVLSTPDISHDNQLEEPTGETKELYKSMVELSPDSIFTIDRKGVIRSCNSAAANMLGFSKDEMVGKHFSKMGTLKLRDVPKYMRLFSSVLKGKVTEPLEVPFYRKDKTRRLVDVRINLLKAGGKTIIQVTARDITERKQMEQEIQEKNEQLDAQNEELRAGNEELRSTEEELRASNEELQVTNEELKEAQEKLVRSEKLAAIGQLASGVGHELRNPLGAIKNAVFYIKRRIDKTDLAATEPRVIEFLDIIDEEAGAANKVITDLLGFSRVTKPAVRPVNIADVIDNSLRHTYIPENINLDRDTDESLPMIEIDADQIQQVFINIINNALQAMPDGGRLSIRAGSKAELVVVEFIDTGTGIPESAMNKIFDPLFTTKAKGIGLGLSVCKGILERHEGAIQAESKPGEGTRFTVSLPIKEVTQGS